ncbi:MAG: helix-turn-helix transcriptional regulator [Thermincola sp.]|nr:helix-turn-helix transcriptional regulator [Thermincola sp.]MDT3702682.1 helix-turn-helix transcriptional regulator [Thermincola sp.]
MLIFNENLKQIMDVRGVNQKWLSDESNIPEATISRYVNGVHMPTINLIIKLAKALNVSVDYLLGIAPYSAISKETDQEINILISAYCKAQNRDRKLIWGLLEDYISPEEKDCISYLSNIKK